MISSLGLIADKQNFAFTSFRMPVANWLLQLHLTTGIYWSHQTKEPAVHNSWTLDQVQTWHQILRKRNLQQVSLLTVPSSSWRLLKYSGASKTSTGRTSRGFIKSYFPHFLPNFLLSHVVPFHCIALSTLIWHLLHYDIYMLGQGPIPMDRTCFIPLLRDLCVIYIG